MHLSARVRSLAISQAKAPLRQPSNGCATRPRCTASVALAIDLGARSLESMDTWTWEVEVVHRNERPAQS